jgi:hypothetical protein
VSFSSSWICPCFLKYAMFLIQAQPYHFWWWASYVELVTPKANGSKCSHTTYSSSSKFITFLPLVNFL